MKRFIKPKWLSIPIAAILIVALLLVVLPPRVSVTGSNGLVSIALAHEEASGTPAYQVLIPNGEGSETGLQVFPPKLQVDGKDNWLAVQSPDGLDVPVGIPAYDTEGDCISVDRYSGAIKVDSLTSSLVITAGALSDKCKYDIEVSDYDLYGGESQVITKEDKTQKTVVTDLRAKFRSYVYGSGSDLYQLEDTPQRQEELAGKSLEITAVRVYAVVIAEAGAIKETASTKILIDGKKYNGDTIPLTSTEQRIGTTYLTNPATGLSWTWQDIDDLQVGVTLKDGELSYVYVEVELVVHSQTFFPIDPVEVTPGTINTFVDVDVSAYVPAGATGVILHGVNTSSSSYAFCVRKNGSTDIFVSYLASNNGPHCWLAIGIDESRIFEARIGNTTYNDIQLVGYTMSGVTLFTNAYDKSMTTLTTWEDIDCHTEAPSAVGLIFLTSSDSSTYRTVGMRENGSTDSRTATSRYHNSLGIIIGCDGGQVCEGYIGNTSMDFKLEGYITDGCTFNTNATDVSLGITNEWLDLAALPTDSVIGFIEVASSSGRYYYGLRENGSAEDIYKESGHHPWAIVECDASGIIEGKIANTNTDFFVVGYATGGPPPEPEITNTQATWNIGHVQAGNVKYFSANGEQDDDYSTITNTGSVAVDVAIQGLDIEGGAYDWVLGTTAGDQTYSLYANSEGTPTVYDVEVKKSSYNYLCEDLAVSGTYDWSMKFTAPTAFDPDDDCSQKSSTITLVATEAS